MAEPDLIFKVASRTAYETGVTSGSFAGMPVDAADGFMHFSTAAQLPETLAKHFAGQADLVLFAVRRADIAADIRWELSRGGALFPHLYAALPMSAVAWTVPIAVAADGSCVLPEAVG